MGVFVNFPPPFISVSGTSGVIPDPVRYVDDGKTAVTVKITTAAAGNLTVFDLSGDSGVNVPVAMTAGDEAASAADIAAAVNAGFLASSWLSMVAISRDTLNRGIYSGPNIPDFSTVTITGATDATVVETRLVIQEMGNTGDGTYYLMDAANPGPVPPPGPNPTAEPCSIMSPFAITEGTYLWIPELGTMHLIESKIRSGGGGFSPNTETHYAIVLSPVPATITGELYAVLPFDQMVVNVRVRNTGGAVGYIDGQPIAINSWYDAVERQKPFVYDATGTTLEFSFDRMI